MTHEGSGSTSADASTTASVSIACGSSANRLLVAWVGVRAGSGTTISTLTYNSVSLTEHDRQVHSGIAMQLNMWRLIAPATGSNTLSLTLNNAQDLFLGGSCFSGVDQTTPLDPVQFLENSLTTSTSRTVTSATDNMVIDGFITTEASTAYVVGASQTSRFIIQDPASISLGGGSSTEPGGASITMSWSWTTSDGSLHTATDINQVGGGTPSSIIPLLTQQWRQRR